MEGIATMKYSYAEVIDCAKRLYVIAKSTIRAAVFVGAMSGAFVGGWIGTMAHKYWYSFWLAVLIGLLFGGAMGWETGKTRAAHLRLEAQNALGQMEMHQMVTGQTNRPPDVDELA